MTPSTLPTDISLKLERMSDDIAIGEKHAAVILGLSVSKLQKDRVKGSGPKFVKNGNTKFARVTYRMSDLRAYQQANTHQSTSTYLADAPDLAEFGLVRPYAVCQGHLREFIESLSMDAEEIIWLSKQDAAKRIRIQ